MEKIINTSVKHLRNRCWDISLQATDANPQPGNKGKVLTSTKSLRFIPWPPWMPVQIFKPIHQVVVPIFKSAPKRWSDRSAIDRTTTVAGTMASTDLKMQSVTDYRPVVYAEEDNWAVRGYKLFNNSIQQLTINPPPHGWVQRGSRKRYNHRENTKQFVLPPPPPQTSHTSGGSRRV